MLNLLFRGAFDRRHFWCLYHKIIFRPKSKGNPASKSRLILNYSHGLVFREVDSGKEFYVSDICGLVFEGGGVMYSEFYIIRL